MEKQNLLFAAGGVDGFICSPGLESVAIRFVHADDQDRTLDLMFHVGAIEMLQALLAQIHTEVENGTAPRVPYDH